MKYRILLSFLILGIGLQAQSEQLQELDQKTKTYGAIAQQMLYSSKPLKKKASAYKKG